MDAYLSIVEEILIKGKHKKNRTGVDTIGLPSATFRHDMSEGFPLLTTKKMATKAIRSELEFFIKGLTDKKWLQDRGNKIWNEWCNPQKVSYGHDKETKQRMAQERDLGPVYGFQWRNFNAPYLGLDVNHEGSGIDQLGNLVDKLSINPNDRRMIVSAWNPQQTEQMALPPCHLLYQAIVIENELSLNWYQRSVDTMLGLPFNIASYGLLLHLLAKEGKFEEGTLTGFLGDTHIYENHIIGAKEQLSRKTLKLPNIETEKFTSIFDWEYKDTKMVGYESHPKISFDIAI
jgi:thymidylate synthase